MSTTAPTQNQPGRWVISKFGPPSVLKWHTWDKLPEPQSKEARVKIIVAGVSGADNIQRAGGYPDGRAKKPGFTPGYDFVGQIDVVGADVADFAPGDLVTSICVVGAYATHIVLPTTELFKLRPSDDPVKITALPLNYMTAFGMLFRSGVTLTTGSSILIGSVSGGVGTAVAQLVRAFGLGFNMFGTCSPGKFDYVRKLGVTPIDRNVENLPERVRELNGGKGVTVAYDAVGSQQSLKDSLAATEDESDLSVVVIGVMSAIALDGGGMQFSFDPFKFIAETPRMKFWGIMVDYYYPQKSQFVQDFESCVEKVRQGELDPIIGKLFPLSDAVACNEMLVSGAGVMGKMEFIVDAELANKKL